MAWSRESACRSGSSSITFRRRWRSRNSSQSEGARGDISSVDAPMEAKDLRGAAAIVGFGDKYLKPGEGASPLHLASLAVRAALQDAGLEKEDIDGVLTGREPSGD